MRGRLGAALALSLLLAGCSMVGRRESAPPRVPAPPRDVASIPDAVPKWEPRSKRGNPPFYTVLGKRYVVLKSAKGYVERGVASWYGPAFDGGITAMGERYDMYGMTAAHKTLPLPTYARVTNLRNGKSVVVRINDRGPFVDNRIIDLSYTAAAKLGMLRDGTTLVEVRAIVPGEEDELTRAEASPPPTLYLQAGAFLNEQNARRLVRRMKDAGIDSAFIQTPLDGHTRFFRVRAGPVKTPADFDRLAAQLAKLGITDVRLVTD